MSRKQVALAVAAVLAAVAATLKQCSDETPILPSAPPAAAADAGAP